MAKKDENDLSQAPAFDAADVSEAPPFEAPEDVSVAGDIAKSGAIGTVKGGIGLAGLPGDLNWLQNRGIEKIGGWMGKSPESIKAAQSFASQAMQADPFGALATIAPTSSQIQGTIEKATGPFYKPKTVPGEYAQTVGEFLPSMIGGPGSIYSRGLVGGVANQVTRKAVSNVLAPAVMTETASQAARQLGLDEYDPYIRMGTALGTNLAASRVLNPRRQMFSADQLHDESQRLYRDAASHGVELRSSSVARIADNIENDLRHDGFRGDGGSASQTFKIVNELRDPSKVTWDIADIDSKRKALQRIVSHPPRDEDITAARRALETLDDHMAHLHPTDASANGHLVPLVNETIDMARSNWSGYKRAQLLDHVLDAAELRKARRGDWFGPGLDTIVRDRLAQMLTQERNPLSGGRPLKAFTPDELYDIERIVHGTPTTNVLRNIGTLAPTGIGAVLAYIYGGIKTGAMIPAAAYAAKKTGEALTRSKIRDINEATRARTSLGATAPPPPGANILGNVIKPSVYSRELREGELEPKSEAPTEGVVPRNYGGRVGYADGGDADEVPFDAGNNGILSGGSNDAALSRTMTHNVPLRREPPKPILNAWWDKVTEPTNPEMWMKPGEGLAGYAKRTFEEAEQASGVGPGNLGVMGTFAGVGSRTASKAAKALAELMEQKGMPREQIRDATNWFRGADKQWKYELPDTGMTLKKGVIQSRPYETTLGETIEHPELFNAYPELKNIPIKFEDMRPYEYATYMGSPERGIKINKNRPPEEIERSIMHEVQHIIQQKENFAYGTNQFHTRFTPEYLKELADLRRAAGASPTPEPFMDFAKRQGMESDLGSAAVKYDDYLRKFSGSRRDADESMRIKAAFNTYKRYAGEQEAELVENRLRKPPEELRRVHPWEMQGVPYEKQIAVLPSGRRAASAEQPERGFGFAPGEREALARIHEESPNIWEGARSEPLGKKFKLEVPEGGYAGERNFSFAIKNELDKHVGELSGYLTSSKGSFVTGGHLDKAVVDWMGALGGPGSINPRGLLQLLKQFKDHYPNVKYVEAQRISGARKGRAADRSIPLNEREQFFADISKYAALGIPISADGIIDMSKIGEPEKPKKARGGGVISQEDKWYHPLRG